METNLSQSIKVPNFSMLDMLSVQPMSVPSGLIFYSDFRYGKSTSSSFWSSADSAFRTKNISSWMYKDTKAKILRDLDLTPLPLP